jgi:hypothetical protein
MDYPGKPHEGIARPSRAFVGGGTGHPERGRWAAARRQPPAVPSNIRGVPLSLTSLSLALRRTGGGDATVHGLRSTFRDWTRQQGEDRELLGATKSETPAEGRRPDDTGDALPDRATLYGIRLLVRRRRHQDLD